MKNVRSVLRMIKQSVLKQVKRREGVGKAKFYIGETGDIIITVIVVLSHLYYVIFSNFIYLTLSNLNI